MPESEHSPPVSYDPTFMTTPEPPPPPPSTPPNFELNLQKALLESLNVTIHQLKNNLKEFEEAKERTKVILGIEEARRRKCLETIEELEQRQ